MIDRVLESDWQQWRDVRLEALERHPDAFGSTYEDERDRTEGEWRRGLTRVTALAYRDDRSICGIAVYAPSAGEKMRHRASLFSMYVRAEARSKGIGDALVAAVLREGEGRVLQVHCSVVTSNGPARRLYERHGFQIYGTEPRALKVAERFHDEYLMVRRLD